MLKKIAKGLTAVGLCVGMLSIPMVKADVTPRSITSIGLEYKFKANWPQGFTATMYEYDQSPTTWKQVRGKYNEVYRDGTETSYYDFDSGSRQGQLTHTEIVDTTFAGWSMNRVTCNYYVTGTYYATKKL